MSDAKILVVDDDLATRMIVTEALFGGEFDVVEAEDGVIALAMFEAERPDAILLDLSMPNLDGYDVCTEIRKRFGNGDVPIMVMTASEDMDAVERAFAAGATDFMTKPVNLQLLPHRMRYMLRAAHTSDVVREIARRLLQSQALAKLVHWHVHSDGEFEWANDPMPTLCPGAPAADHPPTLLELAHPDDRARLAALLASRTAHDVEFRIVLPDGSERIVQQHATAGDPALGIALFGATQDVTERKRAEQQVAKLAYYDDLTGIPNRRMLEQYLEVSPEQPRFAIAIELGIASLHLPEPARDRLIRTAVARVIDRVRGNDFAQRLDAAPRSADAFGATIVGRTNHDELLVISSGDNAAAMARAIEGSLAIPFMVNETGYRLPVRIGTSSYPDPVARSSDLADTARIAMQEAEGTIAVFSAALQAKRARAAAIGRVLDLALATAPREACESMTVRYEARVDPRTHEMIGRRAHTMFDRDLREDIAPLLAADPIRAARVMMWTLARALGEAAAWPAPLRLAGTLSCTQLAAAGGLQMMELALADSGFEPARLDLELVDLPTSVAELDAVVTVFERLTERGICIGLRIGNCTPLQALRRLPLTFLRADPATLAPGMLPVVVAIAETLGLEVAVTGIDTPNRRAALESLDVSEVSGTQVEGPVAATASTVDTCLAVG